MKINAKEAPFVKDEDKALQFEDKKTMAKSQEDNQNGINQEDQNKAKFGLKTFGVTLVFIIFLMIVAGLAYGLFEINCKVDFLQVQNEELAKDLEMQKQISNDRGLVVDQLKMENQNLIETVTELKQSSKSFITKDSEETKIEEESEEDSNKTKNKGRKVSRSTKVLKVHRKEQSSEIDTTKKNRYTNWSKWSKCSPNCTTFRSR